MNILCYNARQWLTVLTVTLRKLDDKAVNPPTHQYSLTQGGSMNDHELEHPIVVVQRKAKRRYELYLRAGDSNLSEATREEIRGTILSLNNQLDELWQQVRRIRAANRP
jgi:type IV pilus biogenesis protein CpaD/CtpE